MSATSGGIRELLFAELTDVARLSSVITMPLQRVVPRARHAACWAQERYLGMTEGYMLGDAQFGDCLLGTAWEGALEPLLVLVSAVIGSDGGHRRSGIVGVGVGRGEYRSGSGCGGRDGSGSGRRRRRCRTRTVLDAPYVVGAVVYARCVVRSVRRVAAVKITLPFASCTCCCSRPTGWVRIIDSEMIRKTHIASSFAFLALRSILPLADGLRARFLNW